jgi:hypothetical protein
LSQQAFPLQRVLPSRQARLSLRELLSLPAPRSVVPLSARALPQARMP